MTLSNNPERSLSESELRSRQEDLEQVIKLFGSVSDGLSKATVYLESAMKDAVQLRRICDSNPALRASMVSRRLAVPSIVHDVKVINLKTSTMIKSMSRSLRTKKDELDIIIQDPELLR